MLKQFNKIITYFFYGRMLSRIFSVMITYSTFNTFVSIVDHIPPISEVLNGDTKIVTEFKRNEDGKLLKVGP